MSRSAGSTTSSGTGLVGQASPSETVLAGSSTETLLTEGSPVDAGIPVPPISPSRYSVVSGANWDDLRLFLALVRGGSVRAAALRAGVGHATVARRVAAFEKGMGVRLLDRSSSGVTLTPAGEELRVAAESVEQTVLVTERRLVGRDQQLEGRIRVATTDVLANDFLMPELAAFSARFPGIDLELSVGYHAVNLDRHEADVALRMTHQPSPDLIGRKVGTIGSAGYATFEYAEKFGLNHPRGNAEGACWIGFGEGQPHPAWVRSSGWPTLPARHLFDGMVQQIAAVRAHMGIGVLPCFIGDGDPLLRRVDRREHFPSYGLWILRHSDSRETARLRAFSEFMAVAILARQDELAGVADEVARL